MIDPENRNAMIVRKLAMQANMLNVAMAELWTVYQELFRHMDLDDEESYDKAADAIIELDMNLTTILGEIREQQEIMCGFFEPRPNVDGLEDFEATVLRGLADLDNMDLGAYDTREEGWDDEDGIPERIPTRPMTPEDMLDAIRNQYYG